MNLDQAQRNKVVEWIGQGLKLSDIQNRLISEFGLTVTYMEVRFLVDDLKLTPKDAEQVKPPASALTAPSAAAPAPAQPPSPLSPAAAKQAGVAVSVDQITKPGAVVSGKVTFSDGNTADWYLDQMGRLGLAPQKPGYRPPAADVQQFQTALDTELSRMGM